MGYWHNVKKKSISVGITKINIIKQRERKDELFRNDDIKKEPEKQYVYI